MRVGWIAGAAALAVAGGAQAAELRLDGVVARVNIVPQARSDISVQVQPGRGGLPVQVQRTGAGVTVRGGYTANNCRGDGENMRVRVRGQGEFHISDAPLITAYVPRSVAVTKRGGAVSGSIGPTQDLSISAGGCSRFVIGDVAGSLVAEQSGGAALQGGSARTAELEASGGGAISLRSVGRLDVEASGGGAVNVASVSGPVDAEGSGGGVVRIRAGRATPLRAEASGGGVVDFDGVAANLDAEASGGGVVRVASATGNVSRSASGGGHVSVGR